MQNDIYNPEYVKRLFDKMSGSYERMNYITSFGFSIRWRNQFLEPFSPTHKHVEILDLLTGMGENWNAIKQKFPNATLSALDFSDGMLAHAKQKNAKQFNGTITILKQDVLNNTLPDQYYDYVTCAFGLKTFNHQQLQTLAAEVKRILKPGGQFSFIEVSKPDNAILNSLYGFYLGRIIPVLGKLLLGDPEEYRMLWHYTRAFENTEKAVRIFNAAGLKTEARTFFGGCASGLQGLKHST